MKKRLINKTWLSIIIFMILLIIPIFSTGDDKTKPQRGDVYFRTDNSYFPTDWLEAAILYALGLLPTADSGPGHVGIYYGEVEGIPLIIDSIPNVKEGNKGRG